MATTTAPVVTIVTNGCCANGAPAYVARQALRSISSPVRVLRRADSDRLRREHPGMAVPYCIWGGNAITLSSWLSSMGCSQEWLARLEAKR